MKALGIDVRSNIDVVNWFLSDKKDVRSSYYMEDVATEFDIQGLELDWACVAWDADFRFNTNEWEYKDFKGTKWNDINSIEQRNYKKNTYRVLLTRARQGTVIFIPKGDKRDITRLPGYYNGIFDYLKEVGIEELDEDEINKKYKDFLDREVKYLENTEIEKYSTTNKERINNNFKNRNYKEVCTKKKTNDMDITKLVNKKNNSKEEMKIGKLVMFYLNKMQKENLLSSEELLKLQDENYSKIKFDLNYPFLKKIDKNKDYKQQRLVKDHSRYWAKEYIFNGKSYFACSEWYKTNRSYFESWLKSQGIL